MSGPNLFERAKSIRMNGENWQNAIQRAKAQLKYETQLGGEDSYSDSSGGARHRKKHVKKEKPCKISKHTRKCGRSSKHTGPAGFCHGHYTKAGTKTCRRKHTGRGRDRHQVTRVDGVHVPAFKPKHMVKPASAARLRALRKRKQKGGSDIYSSMYDESSYGSLLGGDDSYESSEGGARGRGRGRGRSRSRSRSHSGSSSRSRSRSSSKGRRHHKRKPSKHRECALDEHTLACGRSKKHDVAEDLCHPHVSQKTGRVTCRRRRHNVGTKTRPKYRQRTESKDGHFPARPGGDGKSLKRYWFKKQRGGSYFQDGGFLDNLSATSSTRSSDFTNVSDTTSYTMSGGSAVMDDLTYTENDATSVW